MAVRAEDTSLAHMSVSRSRRVEVEEEGHTLGLAAPSPRLAARARADCIDAATLFPSPIPASIVVPPPDLSFAKASGSKSELLLTQTLGITLDSNNFAAVQLFLFFFLIVCLQNFCRGKKQPHSSKVAGKPRHSSGVKLELF